MELIMSIVARVRGCSMSLRCFAQIKKYPEKLNKQCLQWLG